MSEIINVESVKEENIIITKDDEAESVCRWGAARAGAIATIPLAGAVALMANEVYMIMRIGTIYGARVDASAAKGFMLAMAGTIIGRTVACLIPGLNIVVAVTVTYGIGKAAQAWITDGMPDVFEKYKGIFEEMKNKAKQFADEIVSDKRKDQPLGDENQNF